MARRQSTRRSTRSRREPEPVPKRAARTPVTVDDVEEITPAMLDRVISIVEKSCGEGAIERASATEDVQGVIPTGLAKLDTDVFGVGGLPQGKVVQISGPESTGKSTLCKAFIAAMQRAGYLTAFIDAENSKETPERFIALEVDTEKLLWSDVLYVEDAFARADALITAFSKLDVPAGIFADSIAAMQVKSVDEKREFDQSVRRAAMAAFLSDNLKKLVNRLRGTKIVLVLVNQMRQKANAMPFEDPNYEPGGFALRHFCHVTLRVKRIGQIKRGDEVIGIKSQIRAKKNKLAPPFRYTDVAIMFDGGIEEIDE